MHFFLSSSSVHLSMCSTAAVAVSYWFAAPVSTTEKHQELCVVQSPRGFSSSTTFQNSRQYQHQPSDKLITTKYQHKLNPNSKFLTESQGTEVAVTQISPSPKILCAVRLIYSFKSAIQRYQTCHILYIYIYIYIRLQVTAGLTELYGALEWAIAI